MPEQLTTREKNELLLPKMSAYSRGEFKGSLIPYDDMPGVRKAADRLLDSERVSRYAIRIRERFKDTGHISDYHMRRTVGVLFEEVAFNFLSKEIAKDGDVLASPQQTAKIYQEIHDEAASFSQDQGGRILERPKPDGVLLQRSANCWQIRWICDYKSGEIKPENKAQYIKYKRHLKWIKSIPSYAYESDKIRWLVAETTGEDLPVLIHPKIGLHYVTLNERRNWPCPIYIAMSPYQFAIIPNLFFRDLTNYFLLQLS